MSYTAPSSTAVNFQFTGVSYTAPGASAVDLSLMTGQQVTGFVSGNFGVPATPLHATGFTSTAFGSPAGLGVYGATPASTSSSFGTPKLGNSALGFSSTALGSPNGYLGTFATTIGQVTQFGSPNEGNSVPRVVSTIDRTLVTLVNLISSTYSSTSYTSVGGNGNWTVDSGEISSGSLGYHAGYSNAKSTATFSPAVTIPEVYLDVTYTVTQYPKGANTVASVSFTVNDGDWQTTGTILSASLELRASGATLIIARPFNQAQLSVPGFPQFADNSTHTVRFLVQPTTFEVFVDGVSIGSRSHNHPLTKADSVEVYANGLWVEDVAAETKNIATVPLAVLGSPKGYIPSVAQSVAPTTTFGAHKVIHRAEGFVATRVSPLVYYKYDQYLYVVPTAPTRFGNPYGLQPFQFNPSRRTLYASGFKPTAFSEPTITTTVTQTSTGASTTTFGTPRYSTGGQTTGSSATAFGTPTVNLRGRASGFQSTDYGTGVLGNILAPQGFSRTRFGTHKGFDPNAKTTYGFRRTWFGHPSVGVRGLDATGWVETVLGTPGVYMASKALHTAPSCRFGRAVAKRTLS